MIAFLCSEARLVRDRRRVGSRRRHRPGDHLSAEGPAARGALADALLPLDEAAEMNASGAVDAAVLVPLYGWPDDPGLVFTERRHDLRRHAGEISFPGGRLRRWRELPRDRAARGATRRSRSIPACVEVVGALPPIGTFVTNFKVHPIVGLVEEESSCGQARPRSRRSSRSSSTRLATALPCAASSAAGADPHPHLRRRRSPDLGRDRPHPG